MQLLKKKMQLSYLVTQEIHFWVESYNCPQTKGTYTDTDVKSLTPHMKTKGKRTPLYVILIKKKKKKERERENPLFT